MESQHNDNNNDNDDDLLYIYVFHEAYFQLNLGLIYLIHFCGKNIVVN